MPDFLRKAASFVLEHTVSTLFDTGVEKALEQGLHAVFGIKDDTEKILEKLEEVLKGINEVKLAVEELSKKVDVVLYVLRDDAFQGILIEIDTIFISVHSNMIKAREYAKKKGEPGTDKAVAHLQNELDGILKEGIAKIPNVLNKAHYYLGSSGKNSFVQQSVQHAFDESNNIIAYYSRAKTQAMRYWSYTIKGLVLLHMAEKTESVDWLGGSDLIKTFENQFREQEKLLRSTIGENTCELVEMFFTKPEWQRPVRFLVEWGIVIEMHPLAHNQSELQAKGDYKPFPWNLNPARWDADNNIQIQSLEGDWGPFADHRLLFTAKDMEISGALAPNRSAPIDRWALLRLVVKGIAFREARTAATCIWAGTDIRTRTCWGSMRNLWTNRRAMAMDGLDLRFF
ncbi:hypothetical protein EJ08DRAFT_683441 [Tothia fuscella]|uniref:Uncharacterized protein n=1 Tax=Tothia fuscella TaxID=1048955 RepID=A0A9P4TSF2_9PEZI|nr:hypothetical protein EJ08DRAFT_683441 [Tothia fuscella]